jgi:hypothetical protein
MDITPPPIDAREEIKGRIKVLERQIETAEEEAEEYDIRAYRERERAERHRKLRDSYKILLGL